MIKDNLQNQIRRGSNVGYARSELRKLENIMGKQLNSRCSGIYLGCFPFVRMDRPDHSHLNENFTFNQNYPARSVKS